MTTPDPTIPQPESNQLPTPPEHRDLHTEADEWASRYLAVMSYLKSARAARGGLRKGL